MSEIKEKMLSTKDLIIGSLITVVMIAVFAIVGGLPLMVTFVPGLVVCWLFFFYLYRNQIQMANSNKFWAIYFGVLAWQFIHFTEEFINGFYTLFPQLYGTAAYSQDFFIAINMGSYFVFSLALIFMLKKKINFLVIPVLFFLVYGAIGNAISHTWWVVWQGNYFPGFYTAQVYWILGPLALSKILRSKKKTLSAIIAFAIILIPLITIFLCHKLCLKS